MEDGNRARCKVRSDTAVEERWTRQAQMDTIGPISANRRHDESSRREVERGDTKTG